MNIECITHPAGLEALRVDWERLHRQSPDASLFNSYAWASLWWEHYGPDHRLFVITAKLDHVVQGIAPCYLRRSRALKLLSMTQCRWIGSGGNTSPDDLSVLCNPEYAPAVIPALAQKLFSNAHYQHLCLSDIPEHHPLIHALATQAKKAQWGAVPQTRQQRAVDTLPTSIKGFEQQLSRNARKQRRRRRKQLDQAGEVVFEWCHTHAQVDTLFDTLCHLHTLRHQSQGGTGSFHSQRYRDFHRAAMHAALERGELRLLALMINNQYCGVEYAFLHRGTLLFFQTGFDPRIAHLSPGHVLMMAMIDRGIEDGAKYIDLLKGDYDYKRSYAKHTKKTVVVEFWSHRGIAMATRNLRGIKALTHRLSRRSHPKKSQ